MNMKDDNRKSLRESRCKAILESICQILDLNIVEFSSPTSSISKNGKGHMSRSFALVEKFHNKVISCRYSCGTIVSCVANSYSKLLGTFIASEVFYDNFDHQIVKLNPFAKLNVVDLCLKLALFGHNPKIFDI